MRARHSYTIPISRAEIGPFPENRKSRFDKMGLESEVFMTQKLTKVAEGQFIKWTGYDEGVNVRPSCNGKGGYWVCATHGEAFQNQMQKDGHIREGQHQMAWLCFEHGAEVP